MTTVRKILAATALLAFGLLLLAGAGYTYLQYELERSPLNPDAIQAFYAQSASRSRFATQNTQPCDNRQPNRKAFFGALHIHTAASFDATAFGVTNTARDAYAFSRGETAAYRLLGDTDQDKVPTIRLPAPLDFAAVTDHAGKLGERRICLDPHSQGYNALVCRVYRGDLKLPGGETLQPLIRLASQAIFGGQRSARVCGEDGSACRLEARNGWQDNQKATEAWHDYSSNCAFTTFHAYEYTLAKDASNLHRNVIFNAADVPPAVVSAADMNTPEQLWNWLKQACIDGHPECDVITIPHNSNWSSGRMWYPYSYRDAMSRELQERNARLRKELEPLVEIMQVKGDSECRNGLTSVFGEPDELCNFEKLRPPQDAFEDCGEDFGSGNMRLVGCLSRFSYARYALTTGLSEKQRLGTNPFKLGIIAATDNHNGTPTAELEEGYLGANGPDRNPIHRLNSGIEVPGGIAKGSPVRFNPGGLAGLWAQDNSRNALFSSMRRRETFGTSGPRIEPRLFGSWSWPVDICDRPDLVAQGYSMGVPMGADLPAPSGAGASPVFLASASADPRGNELQRIQIVKGWNDSEGRTHQAVYDIAGSNAAEASVDTDTCEVSGPGYRQLCGTWKDKDFDPGQHAVYYARIVENPSCRWSTYACNALETSERPESCSDPLVPRSIQERAWTSPIWYSADGP